MNARKPTTRREAVLQKFCRDAVGRVLLMSSVTGGLIGGCHRPSSPVPTPAPPPRVVEDASNAAVPEEDAAIPHMTMAHKPPVLRATRRSLEKSETLTAFACALPPESGALHEASVDLPNHVEVHRQRDEVEVEAVARSLSLNADYDFVEVVRVVGPGQIGMEGDKLRPYPIVLARAGTPCSGASEMAACERELETKRKSVFDRVSCDDVMCSEYDLPYAVTTQADHVVLHRDLAGMRALFGEIDTPSEAWLLLAADKHAYQLRCEDPIYARQRSVRDGFELATRMVTSSCQPFVEEDLVYHVSRAGKIRLVQHRDVLRDKDRCVVSGRRPASLIMPGAQDQSAGALFARMAHLESASVIAFEVLREELRTLGAPDSLLAAIDSARDDEVRHAQVMTRWASAHGARPWAVVRADSPAARSPYAIALENAVEGCVRELYGALVARFQAARASDPRLRDDLARIADDEAAHAALAYEVAAWLEPRLDDEQHQRLVAARQRALRELDAELDEPTSDQRELCGMPSLPEARALLEQVALASEALRHPRLTA